MACRSRRPAFFALSFILMAFLAGCGGLGGGEKTEAESPDDGVAVYESRGMQVAIPSRYADRLLVFTGQGSELDDGGMIISVYEKQSYEESRADFGGEGGMGFLFGIVRYTRAQYEGYLCSDSSGLSFFARDGKYYYGHAFATDVQFYRSGLESYGADDLAPWTELEGQVEGILGDFVSRNNLKAYSDREFFDREFTYDGEHRYVTYYPYFAENGSRDSAYTLVLSQPARKGEGGIWCVERWYDNDYGGMYYYFPVQGGETDLSAAEYYASLQKECDGGHRPGLLDPVQVSMEFAAAYFGHSPVLDSFALVDGKPAGNVLRLCNQVFDEMGTIQAASIDSEGRRTERPALEVPGNYDAPFSSAADSRLYPIIWIYAERPADLSGGLVVCRSADKGKTLEFYERDNLLCVNVDGSERWFKPAYKYGQTPYDRMLGFYEEFSSNGGD